MSMTITRVRTKEHLIRNLMSWISDIFWRFNKHSDAYKINITQKERRMIATILFQQLYEKNNQYFWNDKEFVEWYNNNAEKSCHYCGIMQDEGATFYRHVDSYRWQRGLSFEIDRKHGCIKTLPESERDNFIGQAKKAILDNYEVFSDLKNALVTEDYFYLPAPYNKDNCVFSCYWCNNAKTDAFTEDEFKPIGKAIATQIRSIIQKINLCDTCKKYKDYPYCTDYPNGKDEIVFGNSVGNDNVCKCSKYELIEGNN